MKDIVKSSINPVYQLIDEMHNALQPQPRKSNESLIRHVIIKDWPSSNIQCSVFIYAHTRKSTQYIYDKTKYIVNTTKFIVTLPGWTKHHSNEDLYVYVRRFSDVQNDFVWHLELRTFANLGLLNPTMVCNKEICNTR